MIDKTYQILLNQKAFVDCYMLNVPTKFTCWGPSVPVKMSVFILNDCMYFKDMQIKIKSFNVPEQGFYPGGSFFRFIFTYLKGMGIDT